MEHLKKYLVEFIGAFFLVFTVGLTSFAPVALPAYKVAIGFVLMVMVYAGGFISGGHYNPAVSLAAAVRGALDWVQVIPYWVAQILGGAAAAGLVLYLVGAPEGTAGCPFGLAALIIGEFLFTYALCYVVLLTATSKATEGNSYYGLAIGSTVMVGAFVAGGVLCFGAFNPAVAFSLWMLKSACLGSILITIATNLVAGILAALTFKLVVKED
ncbi:aquaporin [bacterium]|nr:aquaporin [bacterium]